MNLQVSDTWAAQSYLSPRPVLTAPSTGGLSMTVARWSTGARPKASARSRRDTSFPSLIREPQIAAA